MTGFPFGYYVGYEWLSPPCGKPADFLKEIKDLDWNDISDKYFSYLFSNVYKCEPPSEAEIICPLQPNTPTDAILAKIHCNAGHFTSEDYKWLKENKSKFCSTPGLTEEGLNEMIFRMKAR
jgi:hypothetical protein